MRTTQNPKEQQSKFPAILAALLATILVALVSELVISLIDDNRHERQRSEITSRLATIRAKLEGEINSTLHLTRGIIANVAIHPEIDTHEFNQLAAQIVIVGRNILNIGLARDNVISHMFPLKGNEAAVGLNYEQTPSQWPAVKQAIDAGTTVVAGPVNLVQGGTAFIARTPIFTGEVPKRYWGIASIVIDMPTLFRSAGIHDNAQDLTLAMRGKDGKGGNGDIIFGDATLFNNEAILQTVSLPSGSWQLAAAPQAGWIGQNTKTLSLERLTGWFIALLIGLLIGTLQWTRDAHRHLALHDPLTGLPNRRLLEDRLQQMIARQQREKGRFGVLYIDLDGFKQINDEFGHKTGDALLVEASQRMVDKVRESDTVARIGGDEFIVLADNISQAEDIHALLELMQSQLTGPVTITSNQVNLRASIGTSIFPDDGETLEALLRHSDRKMYEQKQRRLIS